MHLDPVYVAPRKPPPSMTNRRAFLGMGLTFVAGTTFGAACIYSMRADARPPDPTSPSEDDLKLTGDDDLDELRRLAVKAPIEELVERNVSFFMNRGRYYRNDPVLWRGVARLSDEVQANPKVKDRVLIAKQLVATIEHGDPPAQLRLKEQVTAFRKLWK